MKARHDGSGGGSGWIRAARREVSALAGLALAAGALWAFVEIADEVLEGDARAFDRALVLLFRNPQDLSDPIGPGWLVDVALDVSSLGSITVLALVSVAVAGFLLTVGKRHAAFLLLGSLGGGILLGGILKLAFGRPRPELVPHAVRVYTAAFPSGHAMLSAITYLTLGALLARVEPGWWVKMYLLATALSLSLLVGLSRVYLGVHWPTDVLAGWALGAAWSVLCWVAAAWLQGRGAVEGDRDSP